METKRNESAASSAPDCAGRNGAHTPGPWEYNDPAKFKQGFGTFSETAVYAPGACFPWRMAEVSAPSEEVEIANARLIAAAPDLLEALRSARELLAGDLVGAEWKRACHEFIATADAAIALATQVQL